MHTKTKILVILICLFPLTRLKAQRAYYPYFNQYRFDGMVMNPAFAGSREVNSVSFFHKQDKVGFKGNGKYQTVSFHGPIQKINSGLGLLMLQESRAVFDKYDFYANYSYRVNVFAGKLSLGLKAGGTYSVINNDEYIWSPRTEELALPAKETAFFPNFGAGFFYYTRKFFFGASLPLILSEENTPDGGSLSLTNNPDNYNYFLNTGASLGKNDGVKFIPSLLVLYVKNSPLYYIGNINVEFFDEKFSLGTGYISGNRLMFSAQFKLYEKIWFGYTYENSIFGELDSFNETHEVMLRFEFKNVIKATSPTEF